MKKKEFQYGLEEEIEKTTKTFSMNNKKQEINLIEALKSTCRKYTKEKTGKRTPHEYKFSEDLVEYYRITSSFCLFMVDYIFCNSAN